MSLTCTRSEPDVESPAKVSRLHLLGVADDVIDLGHRREALRLDLRRAAGDDDARSRVLAAQPADRLRRLAHGLGGDRAGVDDDRVVEPGLCGVPAHHLGLVGVEPAAERDDAGIGHDCSGDLGDGGDAKRKGADTRVGSLAQTGYRAG